ncbi:MAG: isoleucine--tRNA ligase [Candidatus Micrarchaeota archaeon]
MLQYNQNEIERQILEFWEKNRIPQRLAEQRPDAKPFFLLDGPPYANAQPHVGHVKTTVCKDVWSRYKQMKGFRSYFQAGFDCHGLPTEVMVEKELGITSKNDIEKIGIDKFDALCLAKVVATEKGWMEYYRRLGAWRSYADPYFTYKDYYIESGWWTIKQLHSKGMLTEGEKPVYWCPHCETALSGYEVSDSYKEIQDPSIYVKFKIRGAENEYLLVWTTTPWTLAGNVAVVVHPQEEYVKAKVGDEILIIAEKRAKAILEEKLGVKYEILGKIKGEELDGLDYEPLLDVPSQHKIDSKARKVHLSIPIMTSKKYKKHRLTHKKEEDGQNGEIQNIGESANSSITASNNKNSQIGMPGISAGKNTLKTDADKITGTEEREEYEEFVSMNEGTGLVHCAPGHGQTDFYIGKYYGLTAVSPVDEHGKFTENAGPDLAGIFVKKADEKIIGKLKEEGKLLFFEKIMHRAALCWRCKTPLIYRLSKQWYLRVEPIKDLMISENEKQVKWLPEYGKVKFHNWLVDREDWAISQQRYWGIPLPIWICSGCGKFDVIGSRKELIERSVSKLTEADLTDLHRHTVDRIEIRCANCSNSMKRVRDILNVWFDSGIAPWASLGYPFRNKELFESMFPMDLINESQDQIRGWFDSLMFTSVGVFGKAPYKAVAMMGWVLDEKGEKMSKSLGNVIPAIEGIEKLSADVIRMYYCYEIAPWEVQKFSFKTAEEVKRAYAILFNTYAFLDTYSQGEEIPEINANGDTRKNAIGAKGGMSPVSLKPEDRWIISKLNVLSKQCSESLEKFEFHLAGREMIRFLVDDFSRTYVKLVRDRVSASEDEGGKLACLATIRHVILEYCKLIAPISPHLSEHLYRQLKSREMPESVHFCDYPKINENLVDLQLTADFEIANKITEAANSLRQELKLKLRWPLEEMAIEGDEKTRGALDRLGDALRAMNNAQGISFGTNENFASKDFEGGKVSMPRELSEKAVLGAAYRELTRAVQSARKKNNLVVSDRINLGIASQDSDLRAFLMESREMLLRDVGASNLEIKVAPTDLKGGMEALIDLSELKAGLKAAAMFSKSK